MRDYNRVREKEAAGSIPDTQKGAKNRPTSIQECPVHISDCSCSNCFPLLKPLIPSSITWHPATHQMLSWKDLKPFNKVSISSFSIISKLFGIIHFAFTTFLRHMFFPFFACSFSSANYLLSSHARVLRPKSCRNKTQLLSWGPYSLGSGERGGEESKRKVKVDTVADNKRKTFLVFNFAHSFQPAPLLWSFSYPSISPDIVLSSGLVFPAAWLLCISTLSNPPYITM